MSSRLECRVLAFDCEVQIFYFPAAVSGGPMWLSRKADAMNRPATYESLLRNTVHALRWPKGSSSIPFNFWRRTLKPKEDLMRGHVVLAIMLVVGVHVQVLAEEGPVNWAVNATII